MERAINCGYDQPARKVSVRQVLPPLLMCGISFHRLSWLFRWTIPVRLLCPAPLPPAVLLREGGSCEFLQSLVRYNFLPCSQLMRKASPLLQTFLPVYLQRPVSRQYGQCFKPDLDLGCRLVQLSCTVEFLLHGGILVSCLGHNILPLNKWSALQGKVILNMSEAGGAGLIKISGQWKKITAVFQKDAFFYFIFFKAVIK